MADKKNFISLNRKRIRSSNAISFDAYKDEDGEWKSTGESSNYLIEFDEPNAVLNFKSSSGKAIDKTIQWNTCFKIYTNGFITTEYGFINRIKEVSGVTILQPSDSNRLFLGLGITAQLVIPDDDVNFPVGFNFYMTSNVEHTEGDFRDDYFFKLIPAENVSIYARIITREGPIYTFYEFNVEEPGEASIVRDSLVKVIKIASRKWVVGFWPVQKVI